MPKWRNWPYFLRGIIIIIICPFPLSSFLYSTLLSAPCPPHLFPFLSPSSTPLTFLIKIITACTLSHSVLCPLLFFLILPLPSFHETLLSTPLFPPHIFFRLHTTTTLMLFFLQFEKKNLYISWICVYIVITENSLSPRSDDDIAFVGIFFFKLYLTLVLPYLGLGKRKWRKRLRRGSCLDKCYCQTIIYIIRRIHFVITNIYVEKEREKETKK